MNLSDNIPLALRLIPPAFLSTLYMVTVSSFLALVIGLPTGVLLTLSDRGGLRPNNGIYKTLSILVNIGRSIPFAILILAIIPFTRAIVGTSLGTTASIVPLTIAAIPFIARIVEGALKEVNPELITAAKIMGATDIFIVRKVLIPEALVSLVKGFTLAVVTLVGYSAMAGLVGGGGLGKTAITYGYQRFNGFLMVVTLVTIVFLVEGLQWLGDAFSKKINKTRGK